ncbi:hypothetical protein QFC22_004303 [Naganishia vaughanmartiniae]|uniref:Uncharacterized protein n=1 Tax=Naganishia vaughanmartiniae TaxID=1424756 RepID=A0ACC2X159_9TREE|nr:hypothetical protein QFC22_004303 [Naganishia vaughanmartiniae]
MYTSSIPSRYRTVAIIIFLVALFSLFVHFQYDRDRYGQRFSRIFTNDSQQEGTGKTWYQPWTWPSAEPDQKDVIWGEVDEEMAVKAGVDVEAVQGTRRRIIGMQEQCRRDKRIWEREYGQANVRLAKAYEGSHARLKRVLRQALRGEELVLSTIGGSVTGGFGVSTEEIWFSRFTNWFERFAQPTTAGDQDRMSYLKVNGAIPATGSDYFSFCSALHIPHNSSLILVELSINDEYLPEEHTANIENLLRGLLELPSRPAVIVVQALEFNSPRMANGGDVHLPVAVYYDIPVISMRNPLAGHFMRHPELVHPYFATDWWKNPDVRHINARGHRDMANMVNALVQDVACQYVGDDPSVWEIDGPVDDGDGAVADAADMVELLKDIFEVKDTALPALSTIQDLNTLPDYWKNEAEQARPWGPWHPNKEDNELAKIQHGVWSDENQLGRVPRVSRRATLAQEIRTHLINPENLEPGMHTVECELLEETQDPSGGHEFRIISLMSL